MGAVDFIYKSGLNAATALQRFSEPLESTEIKPKRWEFVCNCTW